MTPRQRIIYDAISAAAEAGRTCPSNGEMAKTIGRYEKQPGIIIAQLVALGHLTMRSAGGFREITIVATGKSTARRVSPLMGRSPTADQSDQLRESCRQLLARQLRTGAHWISDPARMAAAMRKAGIAA